MGEPVGRRGLVRLGVAALVVALAGGCTSAKESVRTPGLEARGTVLTTVKPTRQDLTNRISVAGKVTVNPVFGIVSPAEGELRYVRRQPSTTPAVRPMWVATVWEDQKPHRIDIPEDSIMAGRLMEDRATVSAGMPIVSARQAGYGIVADIDSAQAYRIAGAITSVRGQIKNGPGPFRCTPLGTIAALPAGTIPEPPKPTAPAPGKSAAPQPEAPPVAGGEGSEPTGMRLVCTAARSVKLINGASVTLDIITDKVENALVLPVEAVAGVQGKGKVDLVGEDRTRKTVDVVLGLTDGKVVQIKSGLTGGETVAIPGPNLPTAEPGGQDSGGQGQDSGGQGSTTGVVPG
jgi:hypothetical protein